MMRFPHCGTSSASRSTRTTEPGTSSSPRDGSCGGRRPRRRGPSPTTCPTSCSRPAPPAAARARCAHTASHWTRPRRGRSAAGHQRRPLPVHQPVLPQLRLQGGHPGLPADRRDADPAADVRSREGHGGRGEHRTVLPGPPTIYQTRSTIPSAAIRPHLAAVRGHRRGRHPGRADRAHAGRVGHRHRADRLRAHRGQRFGTMCRADDDAVTVATTCGRPIADFELRIDGETRGEVLLRGPNVMLGYLDDPRRPPRPSMPTAGCTPATSAPSTRRETSRSPTGSRTCTSAAGSTSTRRDRTGAGPAGWGGRVRGDRRARRAARRGRQGVHRHQAGRPLDEKTVIAYTREHLANFKTPRSVEFLDALPRNPGGKVVHAREEA